MKKAKETARIAIYLPNNVANWVRKKANPRGLKDSVWIRELVMNTMSQDSGAKK